MIIIESISQIDIPQIQTSYTPPCSNLMFRKFREKKSLFATTPKYGRIDVTVLAHLRKMIKNLNIIFAKSYSCSYPLLTAPSSAWWRQWRKQQKWWRHKPTWPAGLKGAGAAPTRACAQWSPNRGQQVNTFGICILIYSCFALFSQWISGHETFLYDFY